MKKLILIILSILSIQGFSQIQYNTARKLVYVRTCNIAGKKPLTTDLSSNIYGYNSADSVWYSLVNGVVTPTDTYYPYSAGKKKLVGSVSEAVAYKFSTIKKMYYYLYNNVAGNKPISADFPTSIYRCVNTADSLEYNKYNGLIRTAFVRYPYTPREENPLIISDTRYYVSTSGSDASTDPHNPLTPYKTTYKINSLNLQAGDTVLFKRGDTFICNGIIYPKPGDAVNHIVYMDYGIGLKPVITGFGDIPNWKVSGNWTNTSGNIWAYIFSASNDISRLWINGTEIRQAFSSGAVTSTDKWYCNSVTLTVYSVGNPATTFSSMKINLYDKIFYFNYGGITLKNLDLQAAHNCIRIANGADNFTIDSCNIGWNSDARGILAENSLISQSIDNVLVNNCTFDSNDTIIYEGIEAQATFAGIYMNKGQSNWEIKNSSFSNWGHSCIDFLQSTGWFCSNIKIHDNYFTSPDTYYSRGIGIILNRGTATNIEIYNNVIFDCPVASTVIGENINLHHNIFNNNHRENIITARPYMTGSCLNIDYSGDVLLTNTKYYNNVFANAYDCGIDFGGYAGTNNYDGLEITDNIFYNNGSSVRSSGYQLYIYDQPTMLGNTYKNNLFYKLGVTDLIRYGNDATNDYPHTVAEFNAENGTDGDTISGNITGNPLFVSTTDFHLQVGSPAINAGTDGNNIGKY